jgi:glycerol uptake facilitator-like aquaporin
MNPMFAAGWIISVAPSITHSFSGSFSLQESFISVLVYILAPVAGSIAACILYQDLSGNPPKFKSSIKSD